MQYLLMVTLCTILGCYPPLSREDWQYPTHLDCAKAGYYKIAELAEAFIELKGLQSFEDSRPRFTFYCVKQPEPPET